MDLHRNTLIAIKDTPDTPQLSHLSNNLGLHSLAGHPVYLHRLNLLLHLNIPQLPPLLMAHFPIFALDLTISISFSSIAVFKRVTCRPSSTFAIAALKATTTKPSISLFPLSHFMLK